MSEPNRLTGEAAPNSLWTASPSGRLPAETTAGSSVRGRPGRSTRMSGSRRLFLVGIALAIAGIPFFLAPDLTAEYLGVGLICLGSGIALTVVVRRWVLDAIASARRSKLAAVGQVILAPHLFIFGVAGLGLVGVGLVFLVAALGLL
jgi:hypothetical protein